MHIIIYSLTSLLTHTCLSSFFLRMYEAREEEAAEILAAAKGEHGQAIVEAKEAHARTLEEHARRLQSRDGLSVCVRSCLIDITYI